MKATYEAWHRRLALQIASQMPEKLEDARAVLACIEDLVGGFWRDGVAQAPEEDHAVVLFPGASSSPSRRASSKGMPSGRPK